MAKLSRSFLFATMGEWVLQRLAGELDYTYAYVFPPDVTAAIKRYGLGERQKTQSEFMEKVVTPVMEAFIEQACPGVTNNTILQKVIDWYLTLRHNDKPVLAEDLYKIKESLEYFDSLKNSTAFKESGANPDLLSYESYPDFEAMLAPFRKKKAETAAKSDMLYGMGDAKKKKILAETTILYDGPEGRVVVPHTPDASRFWGNHTRWCISARSGDRFSDYNAKSPVIMILPQGQEDNKVALVDHTLYNSADETIEALPEAHQDLMEHCLAGLSDGARKGIAPWLVEAKETVLEQVQQSLPPPTSPLWRDRDFVLAAVQQKGNLLYYASGELCNDRAVVLTAVQQGGRALLHYASEGLWNDRDFVLAAVQQYGGEFYYASDELRNDRDFVLAVVQQDGRALRYASNELRNDREVVLAAVQQNASAVLDMPESFRRDPVFVRRLLAVSNEFPFSIERLPAPQSPGMVQDSSAVWHPDAEELATFKVSALERMVASGDIEDFAKYARHYSATWGDPDLVFGADPAATLAKIRAEMAPEAVSVPTAQRQGQLSI